MITSVRAGADWENLLRRFSGWFSVERMHPDRVDALGAFFKKAYADQPIAAAFQDQELIVRRWRWFNEATPVPFDGGMPAWICRKGNEIIGHFGVLPAVAVVRGEVVSICWGCELIVAPEARQLGVAPLLIITAARAAQQPLLVAGLNDASHLIFRRLGFLDYRAIPLYLKVYQPHRLLGTMQWPWLTRGLVAGAIAAAPVLTYRRRPREGRLSLVSLERFDERFDRWWGSIESAFPCVVRRTSATMTWRYQHHPDHRYTVVSAMDGQALRGIVIVRRGRWRGLPTGFISELLAHPDDQTAIDSLLGSAQELLASGGKELPVFIRCSVLHRAFERALVRAGFLRAPSSMRWMLGPVQSISRLGVPAPREDWFLNAGDSDLDAL